ncbi:transposase [Desulfobotulus alkaliphilus]|uniref:Transposase n=2 Tax=Desulfobotulus alkaliphilus TaxID=622671 RepID=A0A562QXU9_9BACT|nr:IS110 family transposase [Desulfobotulus alkaliphilus]TWI61020.1 transposase [Desulfobotulus alkaliphilus]
MKTYAGIDLHSSNNFIVVIDNDDKRLFEKRIPNNIENVLKALEPFKNSLDGVVVESTYNWYWLVDGLQKHSYPVVLANPAAIQQYNGLKHSDDKWDSFWLAHLLRLNILPKGYIYPKETRAIRDLLRRRMMYVQEKTKHFLSLQSLITRNLGNKITGNKIKKLKASDIEEMFESDYLAFTAKKNIETIDFLKNSIKEIEKKILTAAALKTEFELLKTIPGVGDILALTIMLEVGDIFRFEQVGNYSSYCRCVKSERHSNGKKKGENNKKNGNKYLSWAYIEAANFTIRYCPEAQRFYQRKMAKTNRVVALKALSNKLARASYYIMRDQVPYDANKLFNTQDEDGFRTPR